MNGAPDLPLWAQWLVAVLLVAGAGLALLGAVGLARLPSFYERVHPPTLGATLGLTCILLASIVCFSLLESRPVMHELLILAFVTLTTPVAMIMLTRAALYRDRTEGNSHMPRDD
jgi:multicomponent K+:H+ antiporter subunit G